MPRRSGVVKAGAGGIVFLATSQQGIRLVGKGLGRLKNSRSRPNGTRLTSETGRD